MMAVPVETPSLLTPLYNGYLAKSKKTAAPTEKRIPIENLNLFFSANSLAPLTSCFFQCQVFT
jgi:hypothetical protein